VVLVSRAPLARLQAYQQRLGWRLPWVSSANSDFNVDFGASYSAELDPPPVEGGLPPIVGQNAAATGTDVAGYLSEAPVMSAFYAWPRPRQHWHAPVGDRRTIDRLSQEQRSYTACKRGCARW
jgi:Bacterial protein of unknown function (DUF899)